MTARLDAFFAALKTLTGIDRGRVTFIEVDAKYRQLGTVAAMTEALRHTQSGSEGSVMHFFWVEGLVLFGQPVWGIAPGAPGAGIAGTPAQLPPKSEPQHLPIAAL